MKKLSVLILALCLNSLFAADTQKIPQAIMHPAEFQNHQFNICENFPGVLYFLAWNGPWKEGELRIDLPDFLRLDGSSYLWSTKLKADGTSEAFQDPFTAEKIPGGTRYRIKLSGEMMRMAGQRMLAHQFDRLYFSALPGSAGKSGTAIWQLTADGISMPEQKLKFNVIPPLNMPRAPLREFKACITMRYSAIGAPTPEIARKLSDFWPSLSSSPVPTSLHAYCRDLKDDRYEGWVSLPSQAGMPAFRPLEFERQVRTGKLLGKYPHTDVLPPYTNRALSPAYMHEDPEGVFAKYLKDGVELYRKSYPTAKYVFWNFEPGVNFTGAYDRKKFCEKLKLPRNLSAEEIRRSYHAQWKAFSFDQSTETIRLVSEAFRKYWPEVKLMVCAGNVRPEQPDMRDLYCSTDPRDYDRYIDWHVPMSYNQTTAFFDQTAATVKYTKKPVLVLVDPNEIRKDFYRLYTPRSLRQSIVAAAAMGAKGIGFYPYESYDGTYLQGIADGYADLLPVEDILMKGEDITAQSRIEPVNVITLEMTGADGKPAKVKLPELNSKLRCRVHRLGKRCAVTLLNYYEKEPVIVKINVPGFYRDILAEVMPGTAKIVHSVSGQQELQAKLNRRLAELRASTNFQSLEKDGVSAQWRALDGQMQPTLTRDKWVFTINKELGGVSAWINPAKVDVMRRRTARGILGGISCEENGIMIPANAFKPAGSEIRNGNPSAIFEYTYPAYEGADVIVRPLEGLRITQRWTLLRGDAAELETTLSNPTKRIITTSVRIQNYPRLGWRMAHAEPITSVGSVKVGAHTVSSGSPASNLFLRPGGNCNWAAARTMKAQDWDGSPLLMRAAKGKAFTNLTITPDPAVNAVYSWWNEGDSYTAEFITRELKLAPGESITLKTVYHLLLR